jgi:hypothetical protein
MRTKFLFVAAASSRRLRDQDAAGTTLDFPYKRKGFADVTLFICLSGGNGIRLFGRLGQIGVASGF